MNAGPAPPAPLLPLPPVQRDPWRLFLASVARVAVNSFGGPIAQIGVMHEEMVERHRWITEPQFLRLLGFANVLPGPEALELLIHIGYLRRGVAGAIVAGLLFILPGFVCLTALAWLYATYGQLPMVLSVMEGIRPIAVALIAAAVLRLSAKSLTGWAACAIAGAAFAASYVWGVPFAAILVAAGVSGLVLPAQVRSHVAAGASPPGAKAARLRAVVLIGVLTAPLVWGLTRPQAAAVALPHARGAHASLSAIALVNTKTALMTFGGAYTSFPYLREQFVERHGWLTDADMVTALALGETTPGPLITVGVFLSYLAAGFPGAVVGCVFLFLPSFVLVLIFGRYLPQVERIRGAHRFLGGVSAGTIGLIVALAADVTPQGIRDPFGMVVAALAFGAAMRFKTGVILMVMAGALLGVARRFVV